MASQDTADRVRSRLEHVWNFDIRMIYKDIASFHDVASGWAVGCSPHGSHQDAQHKFVLKNSILISRVKSFVAPPAKCDVSQDCAQQRPSTILVFFLRPQRFCFCRAVLFGCLLVTGLPNWPGCHFRWTKTPRKQGVSRETRRMGRCWPSRQRYHVPRIREIHPMDPCWMNVSH